MQTFSSISTFKQVRMNGLDNTSRLLFILKYKRTVLILRNLEFDENINLFTEFDMILHWNTRELLLLLI